jgi:hypothetical protein
LRIDQKRAAITVGILAVVHSFLRYLPTFVQQRALPANLMHIIVAIIVLVLLVVSLKLTRSDSDK